MWNSDLVLSPGPSGGTCIFNIFYKLHYRKGLEITKEFVWLLSISILYILKNKFIFPPSFSPPPFLVEGARRQVFICLIILIGRCIYSRRFGIMNQTLLKMKWMKSLLSNPTDLFLQLKLMTDSTVHSTSGLFLLIFGWVATVATDAAVHCGQPVLCLAFHRVFPKWHLKERLLWVRLKGTNLSPTFTEGSRARCHQNGKFHQGELGVCKFHPNRMHPVKACPTTNQRGAFALAQFNSMTPFRPSVFSRVVLEWGCVPFFV